MLTQTAIAVLSLTATYLSLHKSERFRRFACISGLIVQPFWMHTTYHNQQWGMFALCFAYGGLWARNAYQHWGKTWLNRK